VAEGPLSKVEVAHHLHEHGSHRGEQRRRTLEIVEAVLLAIVAIATAWSGYQAAKWSGHQSELYGETNKLRVQADLLATSGGQQKLYDTTNFNAWLQSVTSGDTHSAALLRRRFRPEYESAFVAWMRLDPFHNPKAPPGPIFMPQYHNALTERAARLEARADALFDEGTKARNQGDDYVRNTVLLATVLFLAALAQRFTVEKVRIALLCVGGVILVVALYAVATYPVFW